MKTLIILAALSLLSVGMLDAFGQNVDSRFERKFGDVKFLDAYFGTDGNKMEIEPGDKNVPFTVIFANVGTQDISGIKGQLSLPMGFTPNEGTGQIIHANADSNSIAGNNFAMTFYVNVDKAVPIGQYPGTVKVDYSRIRESGVRNAFFDFNFKLTGEGILNMKALDPFLVSLKNNEVIVQISNEGSAPLSGVDILLKNTESTISSTSQSITNVEKVVFDQNHWKLGNVEPKRSKEFRVNVYVPENMKTSALNVPMEVSYFDAQGLRKTVSRTVNLFVSGLVDARVYNIGVITLSNKPTIIGEIINEGNEDAKFGFVTVEPLGKSTIKQTTQFIDEIDTDSPVPFNIPVTFDGTPTYGENEIKVTVRYKDSLRNEHFIVEEATVFIKDPFLDQESDFNYAQLIVIPIVAGIGYFAYKKFRKKKSNLQKSET